MDPNRDKYSKQYEADLIEKLQRYVTSVEAKIKKSLARAENPVQGNTRIERLQIEQATLLQKRLLDDPSSLLP